MGQKFSWWMELRETMLQPWEFKEVQCSWRAEWDRAGKVGFGSENRPDPAGLENLVS